MRRIVLIILSLFISVLFMQCTSYTINVATVPAKKVEIYVNDEYKATTDENGTATMKIDGASFEEMQLVEAKADNYYGFVSVSYGKGVSPETQNVYSVVNPNPKEGKQKAKMHYNIVFMIPEGETTQPRFVESKIAAIKEDTSFLDESELDSRFEQCAYIATKKEKDDFEKLSFEEKKIFWRNFWQKRDLDLSTEINEFQIQYFDRVRKANKEFSVQKKEGWETDRGRVLILYGDPDEVELFPQLMETKAYEIWRYYGLQGGIEFVFVSLRGGRDMRLVHSTAQNELFDSNWERWLK
ncbi:MAG: GWxTD domain-containing protein [Candidatus Zhuqueibacterota bacterium]